MLKVIIYSFLILFFLILQGCSCYFVYKFDGGRKYKESNFKSRYSAAPLYNIGLELRVLNDKSGVQINRTHYSIWISVDSLSDIVKVFNINEELRFTESIVLEEKSRPYPAGYSIKCYDNNRKEIPCVDYYFTCSDFEKKFRKFKQLHLKVDYDLDSLGVVTHHTQEFDLIRKKYCYVTVH